MQASASSSSLLSAIEQVEIQDTPVVLEGPTLRDTVEHVVVTVDPVYAYVEIEVTDYIPDTPV